MGRTGKLKKKCEIQQQGLYVQRNPLTSFSILRSLSRSTPSRLSYQCRQVSRVNASSWSAEKSTKHSSSTRKFRNLKEESKRQEIDEGTATSPTERNWKSRNVVRQAGNESREGKTVSHKSGDGAQGKLIFLIFGLRFTVYGPFWSKGYRKEEKKECSDWFRP